MTASRFMGSVRRRARAAGPPAPRRPRFSRAAQPLPPPLPPPAAEPLEPRRLLATFVVTTTADDGPGSLRQAILDANAAPGQDRVAFAIGDDPTAVHRIRPLSPLPEVTDSTWITGYASEPFRPAAPQIELDGTAAGPDADGLVLKGRQSGVMGLAIFGFSRHGVVARDGAAISIGANYIGLNAAGLPEHGNGGAGVFVSSPFARVGTTGVFEQPLGNVISGNAGPGVWVSGVTVPGSPPSSTIAVSGNRIGTSPDGTRGVGNGAEGVRVENAYRTGISGNTISANGASGVRLTETADQPQVTFNRIGTDATGTLALGNGRDPAAPFRDGITTAALDAFISDRNVISDNADAGIAVVGSAGHGAAGTEIRGNYIGTNAAVNRPLGTQGVGVRITGGAREIAVDRNVIGGHTSHGVVVEGNASAGISNNQIGARDNGTLLPNGGDGVLVTAGAGVYNNLISGNAGSGVRVAGGDSARATVVGNVIGTDRAGTVAVPNGRHGVELAGGFLTTVADNVVAGNAGHGVYVAAPARVSTVAGNFVGTDRAAARALGNGGSGVYAAGVIGLRIGPSDAIPSPYPGSPPTQPAYPGNTIAHNAGDGVTVTHLDGTPALAVRVNGNSIFNNAGLGIDLAPPDGVTPNDAGDLDHGPNYLQNFPIITRVERSDLDVRVTLRLQSLPGRVYRMELFASTSPDRSGHGEGQRLLGTVVGITSDAAGVATHTLSFRAPAFPTGEWLTATATDSGGSTSEFSPAVHSLRGRPFYRPRVPVAPPTRTAPTRAAPARDALPSATAGLTAPRTPRAPVAPPPRETLAVDAPRHLLQ